TNRLIRGGDRAAEDPFTHRRGVDVALDGEDDIDRARVGAAEISLRLHRYAELVRVSHVHVLDRFRLHVVGRLADRDQDWKLLARLVLLVSGLVLAAVVEGANVEEKILAVRVLGIRQGLEFLAGRRGPGHLVGHPRRRGASRASAPARPERRPRAAWAWAAAPMSRGRPWSRPGRAARSASSPTPAPSSCRRRGSARSRPARCRTCSAGTGSTAVPC